MGPNQQPLAAPTPDRAPGGQGAGGDWAAVPWAPGGFSDRLPTLYARLATPGRAEVRFATGDAVRNPTGAVNGGFLAAMAEQTLFLPAYLGGQTDQFDCVTVDFGVQFLALASTGEELTGEVELLKLTGRMAFVRGTFRQGAGVVVAYTGTIRHGLARRASGGRQK